MKICFATEVTYPNYVNRIKKSSLKCFFDKQLDKFDVHYYISTNLPNNFNEYSENKNIKVFDIDELRFNNDESKTFELFPEDPTGLYPSKYPWNSRRFIIEKAAKDGFNYIIYIDADTVFVENLSPQDFFNQLVSNFEPNTVKTNSTIFRYKNRAPEDVFNFHDLYINHFNLNFDEDQYDTIDGPCQVFMGKTNEDILRFTYNWNKFTIFGYKKEFGYGYGNNKHGNLSFVIPISNFTLKWSGYPFFPNHKVEDRYTHNNFYNNQTKIESNTNEIDKVSNLVLNNELKTLYGKYQCEKENNGFCEIFENFIKTLSNVESSILEIGVGTISTIPLDGMNHVPSNMCGWKANNPDYEPGNSLRTLRDFTKKTKIYGVDVQTDCKILEERIETHLFDSRNPKKSKDFIVDKSFDLIIDDGDHDPNIRIITFSNFHESLKDNGYYVIEGLIGREFLEEYFSSIETPYIIKENFMIINKKNNFNLINIIKNNNSYIETAKPKKNEIIKDYKIEIENSPNFSIYDNILADKGFYINLEESVDRKNNVEKLSNIFEIRGLLKFDALTDDMIQYSCTKSHLAVFETSKINNLETIFVAEDDFDISEYLYLPNSEPVKFKEKISLIKKDLDNLEWDVFLFGCNPKTHIIPLTNNVGVVNKSTGAWAYLIKKRAYQFLLNNLNYKRDYIAIDDYLPILNDKGFITLTSIPMSIGHAVGFVSTLQPKGPVNYTDWIRGSYHKFLFDNYPNLNFEDKKVEKEITIVITGHFVDNYIYYLRYLLHSLPHSLKKCKFLIQYDENGTKDLNTDLIKLNAFFRDERPDLNVSIYHSFGGLISSINNVLKVIKTKYFILLEHDWVFLEKNNINFLNLIDIFEKYNFVNSVWFNKDDNSMRGFEIETDKNNFVVPFGREERISEDDLLVTCRWSNNPAIFRVEKFKFWFDEYINNQYVGILDQGCQNVEETMIRIYRENIKNNSWYDVRDEWGTFLYGKIGDDAYVGHTDASKRYQGHNKSQPEINGENYIKNNPI